MLVPIDPVPLDLARLVARRLRSVLPWRFAVAPPLCQAEPPCDTTSLEAGRLLSLLPAHKRFDELLVALTLSEITLPDTGGLLGYASPERRAAVVSLYRLAEGTTEVRGGRRILVERIAKEVLHESGHLLGLSHCEEPSCVMRYSQALHDTDLKQCCFCPACLKELSRLPEPVG
jgi:archaemetzincin